MTRSSSGRQRKGRTCWTVPAAYTKGVRKDHGPFQEPLELLKDTFLKVSLCALPRGSVLELLFMQLGVLLWRAVCIFLPVLLYTAARPEDLGSGKHTHNFMGAFQGGQTLEGSCPRSGALLGVPHVSISTLGSHPCRGLHLKLQEKQHQTQIDTLVVSSLSVVEGLVVCREVLHPVCPCKLATQISLYPSRPLPSSPCDLGTKVSLYSLAGFPDFSSYQHNETISS